MGATFLPGQVVRLEISGETCVVGELLGSGGQGEVYHAVMEGNSCALKWYYPQMATGEQREAILRLIHKGAPNDRFLWPLDLAVCEEVAGFGYLMPLRDSRYRPIAEIMNRTVDPTFRTLITMAMELADSFLRLHSMGLCYSDISFGNIFLDPATGEVSICDNDNVAVDGIGKSGVLGTPRFMAPEVVRDDSLPNTSTDLYSLAVILFYILMVDHPLEGKREVGIDCLDLAAMQRLYGREALFIFDPFDASNRPVPGVHDNAITFWNLYPEYLRRFFTRAFTDGLRDPNARVRESEWRVVFSRMRDQIFYCAHCQAENFLSDEANQAGPMPEQKCWSCGKTLPPPLRLHLGHYAIVLNQDTKLYAHHLDASRRNDYSEVVAELVPHPTRPDVWGLKNVAATTWVSFPPSGASVGVPTGRSVSLVPGLKINFGNVNGMIL